MQYLGVPGKENDIMMLSLVKFYSSPVKSLWNEWVDFG